MGVIVSVPLRMTVNTVVEDFFFYFLFFFLLSSKSLTQELVLVSLAVVLVWRKYFRKHSGCDVEQYWT